MHSPLWPFSSQLCGSFSRTSSLSTDETKGLRSGNFLTWNASNCYCFPHITATGYHLKRGFSSSPEIPAIWKQGGATTPPLPQPATGSVLQLCWHLSKQLQPTTAGRDSCWSLTGVTRRGGQPISMESSPVLLKKRVHTHLHWDKTLARQIPSHNSHPSVNKD